MVYFLRHKETKKLAKLHFFAMDEYELSVDIGSSGEVYYSTDSYIKAMKVLSQSANFHMCDAEQPTWDTKSFGDEHEIVSIELEGEVAHTDDTFPNVLNMIDNTKSGSCFMVDIPEEKAGQVEIDHSKTDDVLFSDKISYNYQVFLINYIDEKFDDLVGKIVFLDDTPDSLNYVHAIINNDKAIELKLINPKKKDYTMLLVSQVV